MCTSLSLSSPASPAFSSYHWARALARARRKVMMAVMAADRNGRMTCSDDVSVSANHSFFLGMWVCSKISKYLKFHRVPKIKWLVYHSFPFRRWQLLVAWKRCIFNIYIIFNDFVNFFNGILSRKFPLVDSNSPELQTIPKNFYYHSHGWDELTIPSHGSWHWVNQYFSWAGYPQK
jgi:hypothetical protein